MLQVQPLLSRLTGMLLFSFMAFQSLGQVDIVVEGFETDGEVTRYVSDDSFNDGSCNFFNRTNDNNPNDCYPNVLGSLQGSWYWGSEDIDEATNPNLTFSTLTLNAAAVTGFSSLEVRVYMAIGQAGGANFIWEQDDFVRIQYQMDGGGYQTIGQFVGDMQFGGDLRQDTNLDGVADGGAPVLTTTFTEYTFSVPVTGSNMNVRVRLEGHDGSEEFAFDQIRIRGTMTMNAAPVLANIEGTTLMFTEGGTPLQVTNTITVADADDVNMESATISIVANHNVTEDVLAATPPMGSGITSSFNSMTGVLTLMGSSSLMNYQTALRSVTYDNIDNMDPTILTRTVRFQVNDGTTGSNLQNRNISIQAVVNAPVALPYCESFETDGEGSRYTSTEFNSQVNCDYWFRTNATPSCFAEAVSGVNGTWYWASEDIFSGNGGVEATNVLSPLIATGLADFEIEVLLGVTTPTGSGWETDDYVRIQYNMDGGSWITIGAFYGTNDGNVINQPGQLRQDADLNGVADPAGATLTNVLQNFSFTFNTSGTNLNVRITAMSTGSEELAYDNICVSGMAAQAAPVLANIEGATLNYTEDDPPTQITNTITVTDTDDTNMDSARIWFFSGYVNGQDVLAFTPIGGITGTFSPASGALTLMGNSSEANYQIALRSVTYQNTNTTNPENHVRQVAFRINDGTANSNTVLRSINVIEVLDNAGCLPITESFETDGEGIRYHSNTFEDLLNCDLFLREFQLNACHAEPVTGIDGSWMWASEDVISPISSNIPGNLTLAPMSVTDFTTLQASILFGVSGNGGANFWENIDNVLIQYNMDGGGWNTFGLLQGDNVIGGNLRVDTDNNPATFGPYGATIPNASTIDLTFAIPATGSALEVRIVVEQDGGTEELVFDNIRITGTYNGMSGAVCNDITVYLPEGDYVFPPADSALIVDGTDECAGYTVLFNPEFLSCTDIGTTPVTVYFLNSVGDTLEQCVSDVTLLDTIPPLASCNDITVQLDADGLASITVSDIGFGTDICSIESAVLDITNFNCDDVGTPVTVTLTVSDSSGNTAVCMSEVTVEDAILPTVTCPEDQIGYADSDCDVELPDYTAAALGTANDNCGVNTVTQQPAPGTIISGHGTVELITLVAIDESGNFGICSFNFTVQDTTPPVAICQDVTVQLDAMGTATLAASSVNNGSADNCEIQSLSISETNFNCIHIGSEVIVLTVTDGAGNTATCTSTVTVQDPLNFCCDLPIAICQDVTVYLDGQGNASIGIPNVDNGSTADCGFDLVTLSPNAFDCDDIGAAVTVLTITDSNGNVSSCTATVTVIDDLPPSTTCPDDVIVECGPNALPAPSPTTVIASDNCGVASVVWDGDVSAGTCPEVVTRTYLATDVNGNTTSCIQTITIVDTTPPSISCPEDDVIDCDEMTCLTFDESTFNPLGAPVIVTSVMEGNVTVDISAYRKGGIEVSAALFDSEQPVTEPDLGTPNVLYGGTGESEMDPDGYNASNDQGLGNLLIIQNPLAPYPDDHILGDSVVFDFDRSVYVSGISMIDFEAEQVNSGAGVYMYDQYDALLGFVGLNAAEGGDNSVQDLYLNTFGVRKLVVYYGSAVPSSGAIGNLCYTFVPFDAVITDLCQLQGVVVDETAEEGECSTIVGHTYTASDECGNIADQTCVTTIFGDYLQPDIVCPDDITIGCEEALPVPDAGQVVATDNCSSGQGIFVTWVEDIADGEECAEVIRRIYSAADDCGNVSLCVQFITREELPPAPGQVQLNARVMLSGPMESGDPEMHPMINDLLPEQQPYSSAPFNYGGFESVTEFGENIVDWVLIDLRDVLTMEVIAQRSALVTATGDIVDLDGVSPVMFNATADQYYVVICHRNHLDIISDGPIDFSTSTGVLDLTLGNAGMIEVSPGHWAMIKGDAYKDGLINNTDLVTLAPFAAVGYAGQYLNLDVNMDGLVNNTDLVLLAPFAAIGFTQGF